MPPVHSPATGTLPPSSSSRTSRFHPASPGELALIGVRRLLLHHARPDKITDEVLSLLTDLEKCVSMGTPFWEAVQMHVEWRRVTTTLQKTGAHRF